MRPQRYTVTPVAASTTSIATGLTGAGPFTTFTASSFSDGLAHIVSLTSAANLSAINITIVGTDYMGLPLTETRAGPNINTVSTTASFKTITSITASSTLGANTMNVGHLIGAFGVIIPVSWRQSPFSIGLSLLNTTGTNTVQITTDDVLGGVIPVWFNHATLAAITSNTAGVQTTPITAVRLNVTAWTSGTVTLVVLQDEP